MENFSYPIKLEPLNRPVKQPSAPEPVRPRPTLVSSSGQLSRKKKKASASIGLREQRERNGVPLESIAEHTRIPLRHLQELERGDVKNWPAGVYARSWARDYANEAGIDPDRVIAIVAPIAEVEPTIDEIKQVREEAERMRVDESPFAALSDLMKKVATVMVVLALIAIAAVYFWRRTGPDSGSSPAPVGTSGMSPAPAAAPAAAGQSPR